MKLHTIILIGRSGCGKGTQATLLKNRITAQDGEKRRILYIETGDKFREFIRGKSLSSRLSKEIYESDALQPGFLACFMWANMLLEELEENMHLVFDGAPRSLAEAQMLGTALEFYKREHPTVIHLKVSRKWSENHLLARGRQDDRSLSKITKRLDWFDHDVVPALEYYKSHPNIRFMEIDGEQPIEKVYADIIREYEYSK